MYKSISNYYDFITKVSKTNYIVNFPKPVNINIGKYAELKAINVKSISFTTSYLFLDELRNDYKSGKIKNKQITITNIDSDKLKRKKNIKPNNDIKNDADINNISLGLISSPSNYNNNFALYNPYDQTGDKLNSNYLDLLSNNIVMESTIINTDKINKDSKFEINTYVQYVNIIINKTVNNYIEYKTQSGELINTIIKIENDGNKKQYVNLDTENESNNDKTLQMITEDNNLIIGRTFAELLTKRGIEYVLHGQYSEYKILPNNIKEPRNMLVFNDGLITESIDGNRDPLAEVIARAQNYNQNVVKKYFLEKYKNHNNNNIDDYGSNKSANLLMF